MNQTVEDSSRAQSLAVIVRERRKTQRPFSLRAWALQLAKLRHVDGISEDRIQTVFDWYIQHFDGPYVPQAYSGKGFRDRFFNIEAAMERQRRDRPEVTVSADAQTLARKLAGLGWPKGSDVDLAAAVQISMDGYGDFLTRFKKVYRRHKEDRPRHFIHYVYQRIGDSETFVERWFRDIHKRVRNWPEWSGKLFPLSFRYGSKEYQDLIHHWAEAYGGADEADGLLEELTKEAL